MHQSPQKLVNRREKYGDLDAGDAEAERRLYRGTQPKARKISYRDEAPREQRSKQHPRG